MAGNAFNAYLTLIPKLQAGSESSIHSSLSSTAKKGGVAIAAAIAAGAAAATAALVSVGKAALESYAKYEQLVGGVDTLFKDSSGVVQEYAANAYKTAGLSANAYMETVTGFSASLLQSLGNDTAKAAQYADVAVTDMADNANKMGTSIGSIQDAYQGFAKQNYTMLDNLKLGYGGTKEEMERLIEDANKLREAQGLNADLTIESFSDIVEAIHTVQKEMDISGYSVDQLTDKIKTMSLTDEELAKVAKDMGITQADAYEKMRNGSLTAMDAQILLGTTAREAATTIEGSVNSAKAAWENWITGLGNDTADLGELTSQLVDSISIAASNIVPRLGVIFQSLATELPQALSQLAPIMIDTITQIIPQIVALAPQFLEAFFQIFAQLMVALAEVAPLIIEQIPTLINSITELFAQYGPVLLDAAIQLFMAIVLALAEVLPELIVALAEFFVQNQDLCIMYMGQIGLALLEALGIVLLTLGVKLGEWMAEQMGNLLGFFGNIISGFGEFGANLINGFAQTFENMGAALGWFIGSAGSAISGFIGDVTSFFQSLWGNITSIAGSMWDSVTSAFWNGVNSAISAVSSLPGQIMGIFSDVGNWLYESGASLIQGFVDGVWGAISGAAGDISNALSSLSALFPHSPAKEGPFSGKGWTLYSGMSTAAAFGEGFAKEAENAKRDIESSLSGMRGAVDIGGIASDGSANLQDAISSAIAKMNVAVVVDGRQLAASTAGSMDIELGMLQARRSR